LPEPPEELRVKWRKGRSSTATFVAGNGSIRQLYDEADEEPNTIREKGMCVAGHTQELRCRGRSIRRARGSPA
jgi:hypothetical protein